MAYLGKTPSQAVRQRYIYTASGSETSISGADDNGNTLSYTDGGYVDVYLNGVLLVAGTDYNTTTANTIGGLTALSASDVVEIVVYDVFSVFGGDVNGDLDVNGALSSETATFNRNTTDGTIVDLTKDGTTVGSIGVSSSDLTMYGDVGIRFSGDDVRPINSSGAQSDGAVDLGHFDVRWRNLYLSGGVYLGGTGAANYLDDYEEGTFTPALQFGTSVSYTNQTGTYTKIGNIVHFEVNISATFSSDTSAVHVSLPFAPTGSNRAGAINYNTEDTTMFAFSSSANTPLGAEISSSSLRITAANGSYILYNEAQSGTLVLAGSYRIA